MQKVLFHQEVVEMVEQRTGGGERANQVAAVPQCQPGCFI